MKKTIKSLVILGLLSNYGALFSIGDNKATIREQVKQSYLSFRAAEQSKKKLRYLTGGIGLMGIGGLIYYSMQPDATQKTLSDILNRMRPGSTQPVTPQEFDLVKNALKASSHKVTDGFREEIRRRDVAALASLSWSASARNYVVSSIKNSFFGLSTMGTAIAMMVIQAQGATMLTKGVLNPLMEKFVGTYSIHRFISTKTMLTQNIRDLILSLNAINKENTLLNVTSFNSSFNLLEKDIINILGFMVYICSFISKDDPLGMKARVNYVKVIKCLTDLQRLKKDGTFYLEEYRKICADVVSNCKSFSQACPEAGTDWLDDLYMSTFEQLENSIDIDLQQIIARMAAAQAQANFDVEDENDGIEVMS